MSVKSLFKKPDIDEVYLFEDFVCNDFFKAEYFDALHLTGKPGEIIEDDHLLPDFRFRQIDSTYEFFIKTKYYVKDGRQLLKYCDAQQYLNYKIFNEELPFYVMIGCGGKPSLPGKLYLIPIKYLESNQIEWSFIDRYAVVPNQKIDFYL